MRARGKGLGNVPAVEGKEQLLSGGVSSMERCWGTRGCEYSRGKRRTRSKSLKVAGGGSLCSGFLWVSIKPRELQGAAELENNTGGINLPFKGRSKRSVFQTFLIYLSTTFPI